MGAIHAGQPGVSSSTDCSAASRRPLDRFFDRWIHGTLVPQLKFSYRVEEEAAVLRARTGESYVIQGPPGTGKSQTIANLLADFAARGYDIREAVVDIMKVASFHPKAPEPTGGPSP